MLGTSLVEMIMNYLGRIDLSKPCWSWIPESGFLSRLLLPIRRERNVGYSPTQARLLALVISSILHGIFFVMMGSRRGFWVCFLAYALAAFARSILTGMSDYIFDLI